MRMTLAVVVLAFGSLSTPWLGGDQAILADEVYPDATLGSTTKPSSSTNLIKQAKDLLSNTRAGKLIDLGTVTVQFVVQGSKWSNTNISVSFMPDGTLFDGEASGLFNLLDQRAARAVWQREFARAWPDGRRSLRSTSALSRTTAPRTTPQVRHKPIPTLAIFAAVPRPTVPTWGNVITPPLSARVAETAC